MGGDCKSVYPRSVQRLGQTTVAMVRTPQGKKLFLSSPLEGFDGERGGSGAMWAPLTPQNARALARWFPWLVPNRQPSGVAGFGFGDRLGLATPGHVAALEEARLFPVLAQQSERENTRTGRGFAQVLADAIFGAFQEGYRAGFGADADHLKTLEAAGEAALCGFRMFTCDPSEHIVPVEDMAPGEVAERYKALSKPPRWEKDYLNRDFSIEGLGVMRFTEEQLVLACVKYAGALSFAAHMFGRLREQVPGGFDFELSVDESAWPTTPHEHLFLALELRRLEVGITSFAPRFPGVMEKGLDWQGDLAAFRSHLRAHCAIATAFGPYRISLHSGSDKFSLYPLFAELDPGLWHVKTAGVSYLTGLGVLARREPEFFREILGLAAERFCEDRQGYQISSELPQVEELKALSSNLEGVLFHPSWRQALHVTYGSVLQSPLGADLRRLLGCHEEEYRQALQSELGRHLQALGLRV